MAIFYKTKEAVILKPTSVKVFVRVEGLLTSYEDEPVKGRSN